MEAAESVSSVGGTPDGESRLPIHYEYCIQVYEAMTNEASVEHLGAAYGDEQGLVYDGFTTALFRSLGLSVPYYSKILGELQRMDCVRQLRRGGSTTTSRWLLLQEPTVELFRTAIANRKAKKGTKSEQQAQQIRDLNGRVSRIEEALGL